MTHQRSAINHKLRRRIRKEEYFFNHGYWPEDKKKHKTAKDFVTVSAYKDYILDESVCTVTSVEVLNYCIELFKNEGIPRYITDRYERGLITFDSRGRGEFQK